MRRNQSYQEPWAELYREKEGHVQNFKMGKPLIYPRQWMEAGAATGRCQTEELEVSFKGQTEARSHGLTGQCEECELESEDHQNLWRDKVWWGSSRMGGKKRKHSPNTSMKGHSDWRGLKGREREQNGQRGGSSSGSGRTLTQKPLETGWRGSKGPDAVWPWRVVSPTARGRRFAFEKDTWSKLSKENSRSANVVH